MMTSDVLRCTRRVLLSAVLLVSGLDFAAAEKKYDAGASDTEIKIGNTMPYSGPLSALSGTGKAEAAYYKMINARGGINGRKINFISYDDGYSPPKTVEQARRLVESDEVLFLASTFGTAPNSAIQKYMNAKKVPHLFVASAADKWSDPKNFPWTIGWMPSSRGEALVYAKYVLQNHPTAKIAVLFQNDDFGKDYLVGLREGLGEKAGQMIVMEAPYEVTSPTIDSQLVQIKAANPDIFLNFSSAKVAAQSIRKMAELGWKPIHILSAASTPIEGVMRPAGFDNAQGILSVQYMKSAKDPQWNDDPDMKEWITFMNEFFPEGNKDDSQTIWGYGVAKAVVQVLIQCGDELTRANVMKQAANLDFYNGVTLPGIRIKTSPTNFRPINQFQMMRFKDGSWLGFGPLLGAD